MNIYRRKFWWKVILMVIALVIVGLTLLYNNQLAKKLAVEERKKVEVLAMSYSELFKADPTAELNLERTLIVGNNTIPVIITDSDNKVYFQRNLDPEIDEKLKLDEKDNAYIQSRLEKIKATGQEPIEVVINEDKKQYLYYDTSNLLTQLIRYPFIQLGIIGLFLGISYLAFSSSRRAEQDQVWVGMARETAHQLGTPLSSLVGWIEMLKSREEDGGGTKMKLGPEMEKDVARLELIAERFSKIGSAPKLESHELSPLLEKSFNYMKRRAGAKVQVTFDDRLPAGTKAKLSPPLFDWVIENLMKNGLDAMDGKGDIILRAFKKDSKIFLEVQDSGKGIPKSDFQTIFQPGYSTKKRGWGLGLSLSKRIIEEFQKGKISVAQSTVGKGTTFRIVLPA